jgi:hypothetical protein
MRCYNAAMGKPFQFSMRRMLIAVSFWCAGLGMFKWLNWITRAYVVHPVLGFAIVFAAGAFVGGGIGVIIRRPILCAVVGGAFLILAEVAWFVFLVWTRS